MDILTIILLYLLINVILTLAFLIFIPGKMESMPRYVSLMLLLGLPAAFAYVGIGAFVMIIKLFHTNGKKQDS